MPVAELIVTTTKEKLSGETYLRIFKKIFAIFLLFFSNEFVTSPKSPLQALHFDDFGGPARHALTDWYYHDVPWFVNLNMIIY